MKSSTLLAPNLKLKEEQADGKLQEDGGHEAMTGGNGLSSLELRLGISSDHNGHGDGDGDEGVRSSKPWLAQPWGLAARQEKAAPMGQAARQRHSERTVQKEARPPAPPLVGWPPVRAFRKNLGASNAAKATDGNAEEAPACNNEMSCSTGGGGGGGENAGAPEAAEAAEEARIRSGRRMFVKVNLEGCAVGRKIDLSAHGSYHSLSRALQAMFRNFFSVDYYSRSETKEEEQVEAAPKNYILLYEDTEGDRMLVGDVPWELFLTSVKRLYIAHDPRVQNSGKWIAFDCNVYTLVGEPR